MNKPLRIFCLPSHQTAERTSGVDLARIIQPMTHLNGFKGIETTIFDINQKMDWLYVAKNFDVIYFNYLNDPWGYSALGAMARGHGVKIVLDVDDALWNIRSDNPAYSVYRKGSKQLRDFVCICNDVDYITCTNDYLKNVIISNTNKKGDKIKVFPNYIDLSLYKYRAPFKDTASITLTHFGSSTHYIDLSNFEFFKGVDKIMKEYPNVNVKTVGAFVPKLRQAWGQRYENVFGHQDIYHWIQDPDKFPKIMSETDIMIVPLESDVYNRCKSGVKFTESSSAKIPGVFQDLRQYREIIEDGVNGFLAETDKDWYRKIKRLIDDKELRQKMGEAAFKTTEDYWQMNQHLDDYEKFFKMVVDNVI